MLKTLHAVGGRVRGGLEVLLCGYLEQPAAAGLEHHVLILGRAYHPAVLSELKRLARSTSWAHYWHGVKLPSWPRFLRAGRLRSALRNVSPHVAIFWNSIGPKGLVEMTRSCGARTLYCEMSAGWKAKDLERMASALKRMDFILCCGRAARRMLELRFGIPEGSAHVLRNPPGPHMYALDVPPREHGLRSSIRIGAVGQLIPRKGIALAIRAVHRLRVDGVPCELRIAGEGPDEPVLRALAQRLGVAAQVHFAGWVQNLAEFYRSIDVLVCPSVCDPYPLVCIEAGYMGCPVICPAVDGFPEIVADGLTGFCVAPTMPLDAFEEFAGRTGELPDRVYDPGLDSLAPPRLVDPANIAEKVHTLWEDAKLIARMSQDARARILAGDSFAVYAAKFTRIIRHLAGDEVSS